ncbi:MAG TPA: M28 family peptidase [Thermoanaerobaculia bacterium]|nr:M28 family peptidase [Thermoanaerobaculia bacterium]
MSRSFRLRGWVGSVTAPRPLPLPRLPDLRRLARTLAVATGVTAAASGEGTSERDYAGREVRGKLVLAGAQPAPVAALAVDRFGAAGIVSYAQNQVTAWWREDENLVRWGHLASFPPPRTFAFMVSLKQARAWQERLSRGESVHLRASVRAGQHPGSYDVVTAVIPGEAAAGGEEIVFSCHLDHLRPGANDNASGCATILEAGRALAKLIREGKIAPPHRTLRFVWPPEVEGSLALLNARPELAGRARAVVHMDMVGGDAEITKAVFHVTRSPRSLPTFVNDVGEAFGRFVNTQSDAFAATGAAPYPLADPEGGKRALQAEVADFTLGSDHEVWSEGSWRVPAIYLNDWPDRTIHTDADTIANIDATKLLRAAFIGAASAYYLAQLDGSQVPALLGVIRRHALERTAAALARRGELGAAASREAENLLRFHFAYEAAVVDSISAFAAVAPADRQSAQSFLAGLRRMVEADGIGTVTEGRGGPDGPEGVMVYRRNASPRGPMTAFGYSYLEDQLARRKQSSPALLQFKGLWGAGADYAYEALNLVDGKRMVRQIRDDLAAIYGPVSLAQVADYLDALERIGVVRR